MENIKSIISNNPFYLAQLTAAPEPVKFDIGGVVKKVDNTGKYLAIGIFVLVGGLVIYNLLLYQKQVKELKDKIE